MFDALSRIVKDEVRAAPRCARRRCSRCSAAVVLHWCGCLLPHTSPSPCRLLLRPRDVQRLSTSNSHKHRPLNLVQGVKGLFTGAGPTVVRAMALNMGMLASNDQVGGAGRRACGRAGGQAEPARCPPLHHLLRRACVLLCVRRVRCA